MKLINVDHEGVTLRTFILFVQTARVVMKYADTYLYRKARLSIVKLITLLVLASNDGIMNPSEIAAWTQTERHNITALINRMRRDGLVTTERSGSDKRLVNVILTNKGRDVLSQAMPVAREVVDQVTSSITEGDAGLLEQPLRALRQNAQHGGLVRCHNLWCGSTRSAQADDCLYHDIGPIATHVCSWSRSRRGQTHRCSNDRWPHHLHCPDIGDYSCHIQHLATALPAPAVQSRDVRAFPGG